MALFTTNADGNVSDGATWVGGVAPDLSGGTIDTWQINHAIVVDVNASVGESGASGTFAITLANTLTSKITIAAGVKLTCKGGIVIGNVAAGAITDKLVVNGTLSFLIPAATTYTVKQSTANYNRSRIKIAGVAGTRAVVEKDAASGAGSLVYFDPAGFLHSGFYNFQYARFKNIGSAAQFAFKVDHYERLGVTPEQILNFVEFDGCGEFYQSWSGFGAKSVLDWDNVTYINTPGNCLNGTGSTIVPTTGTRTFNSCSFDKTCNVVWGLGTKWEDCLFNDFQIQATAPATWFKRCAFWCRNRNIMAGHIGNGTYVLDCIYVHTWPTTDDPHATSILQSNNFPGVGIDIEGCVVEGYGTILGRGNAFLPPGSVITDDYNINLRRCLLLPTPADGQAFGDLFHHYSQGTSGPRLTIEHCTVHARGEGQASTLVIYSSTGLRVAAMRSNIYWDSSSRGSRVLWSSGSGLPFNGDVMLANLDYNCLYNLRAGTDVYGEPDAFTYTTDPGVHDLIVDPQFVDSSRNIAKWYRSLAVTTGTDLGDADAAIDELRKVNDDSGYNAAFTVTNYLTYLLAGFTPQNTALATAAHDGTTMGAIQIDAPAPSSSGGPVSRRRHRRMPL